MPGPAVSRGRASARGRCRAVLSRLPSSRSCCSSCCHSRRPRMRRSWRSTRSTAPACPSRPRACRSRSTRPSRWRPVACESSGRMGHSPTRATRYVQGVTVRQPISHLSDGWYVMAWSMSSVPMATWSTGPRHSPSVMPTRRPGRARPHCPHPSRPSSGSLAASRILCCSSPRARRSPGRRSVRAPGASDVSGWARSRWASRPPRSG